MENQLIPDSCGDDLRHWLVQDTNQSSVYGYENEHEHEHENEAIIPILSDRIDLITSSFPGLWDQYSNFTNSGDDRIRNRSVSLNIPHSTSIGDAVIDLRYSQFLYGGKRPFLNIDGSIQTWRIEYHHQRDRQVVSCSTAKVLYEMSCSDVLCDAVIFVEGARFTVHSSMLCTCSSYFKATFTGGLNLRNPTKLSTSKQEIVIPHISGVIMAELVKYAYLRKASITRENVHELLVTADYFGINGMMNRCKDFLIDNLTPQDCVNAMLFARYFLMNDLYSRARMYVLRYFPYVALENQEILQLEVDEFYGIISDDNLNTRDEDLVWRMCLKWIEYDLNERRQHVAYLLGGVRLGLMTAKCFMEEVKDNPLVLQCNEAKPVIVEAFKFMYDLDIVNSTDVPLSTPALAMPRLPHEVIFAIGGWTGTTATSSIETYDTRSDRWILLPTESAPPVRAYHGSAVIGFKIYCIGGYDGIECFNKCHVFDVEQNAWSEIAPMYCCRCYVSVTFFDGYIYAFGGYDGWHRLCSAERYDPATNQWCKIASLLAHRSDAGCCTLNGKIYVVGGCNGLVCLDSAEVYDPEINRWTMISDMSQRRSGVSCVAFRGYMYVVGGFNGTTRLVCAERYDPIYGNWTSICNMSHPRSNFGLEIIDDMIFAVGGFDGVSTISLTECYVPETNEWMEATNMNNVRSAMTINTVCGLPMRRKYMYKDRNRLVEERKQRLIANAIRRAVQVTITRQVLINQAANSRANRQHNTLALHDATVEVTTALFSDVNILTSAQQSQDEEARDIAVALMQQDHRINCQLENDVQQNRC